MSINAMQLAELSNLEELAPVGFQITTLEQANWALRKLAAVRAKGEEIKQLALAEHERIKDWEIKEVSALSDHEEFFLYHLGVFHAEQLELDPKAKSISTPYGTLKSVTRKPSPKNEDDEKLLSYLKASGFTEHIKTIEKPQWGEFKKTLSIVQEGDDWFVVDQSGFPVPGVTVEMGGTKFSVEVSQ